MPKRSRPLLAVRLIGPADVVIAHKRHLLDHFADMFGECVICRASTHPAGYAGEARVYPTVSRKKVPPR